MSEGSVGIRPLSGRQGSDILMRPFQEFTRLESAGGVVLLVCSILAVLWANSAWSASYFEVLHTEIGITLGSYHFAHSMHHWVNDGLMVIFFFVVGLEIKRELVVGELSIPRNAVLPVLAALGGALLPAAIYAVMNFGTPAVSGWGVPMATDIAFALGFLTLLGSRAPLGLKVFLTALAIVDDLAAVAIIALFYTAQVEWAAVGFAVVVFGLLVAMNKLSVRHPLVYIGLGIVLWLAVLASGVHATIAGVLLAMTVPVRSRIDVDEFIGTGRQLLDTFDRSGLHGHEVRTTSSQRAALRALETACQQVETPLHRLEHAFLPWITFLVLPVFAFANAGVVFSGSLAELLSDRITLGVVFGLVIGKPIGITLMAWWAVRLGIGRMPNGVTWRHIHGAAWLGGIGFTMALFIAGLAFADPEQLDRAKLGVILGSIIAATVGYLILRSTPLPNKETEAQAP